MKEKHLPYFEVLDSFEKEECPLCFFVIKKVEKFFDALLYEYINENSFRINFRNDYGFCNYHSYKFLNYNDGLAVALTHFDLLKDIIEKLEKKDYQNFLNKKSNNCMICKLINQTEKRYVSVIKNYISDEEIKNKILLSEGFCVPHLVVILKEIKKIPDWFLNLHIKKYKEILKKLEEYMDYCNFTLKNKTNLSIENQNIWRKVVKFLFGFEGKINLVEK